VVKYLDTKKLRRYKIVLVTFLIITIIPSTVIFYGVIQEARFKVLAEKFVSEKCDIKGSALISHKITYSDTVSSIDLYFIGNKIQNDKKDHLKDMLDDYGITTSKYFPISKIVNLNIHQEIDDDINIEEKLSEFNNNLRINILEDIYKKNEETLKNKDEKIRLLEDELVKLSTKDTIPFIQLNNELRYHFPQFDKYAYSNSIEIVANKDTNYYDTIPVFMIKFKEGSKTYQKKELLSKTENWLRVRLNNAKVMVLEY
jgi:hypothetical protein